MSKYIKFNDKQGEHRNYSKLRASGHICIRDLNESFSSSLKILTKSDYRSQWMWALGSVLAGRPSCLVTDWCPEKSFKPNSMSGMMYCLYPISRRSIAIRQNMIINKIYFINSPSLIDLTPMGINRRNKKESRISEWTILKSDVLELMDSIYTRKGMD